MSKSEKSIQKTVQMEVTTRTQRTWFSVRRSEEYLQDSLIPICNLIPRTMPWVKQVLDNHLLNEFLKCCKLRKKKKEKKGKARGPDQIPHPLGLLHIFPMNAILPSFIFSSNQRYFLSICYCARKCWPGYKIILKPWSLNSNNFRFGRKNKCLHRYLKCKAEHRVRQTVDREYCSF